MQLLYVQFQSNYKRTDLSILSFGFERVYFYTNAEIAVAGAKVTMS